MFCASIAAFLTKATKRRKSILVFKSKLPDSVLERRAAAERRELERLAANTPPPPQEPDTSPGWSALKTPAVEVNLDRARGWSLLNETPDELRRRRGKATDSRTTSPALESTYNSRPVSTSSSDGYIDVAKELQVEGNAINSTDNDEFAIVDKMS